MNRFISTRMNGREYLLNVDHIVYVRPSAASTGAAIVRFVTGENVHLDDRYEDVVWAMSDGTDIRPVYRATETEVPA